MGGTSNRCGVFFSSEFRLHVFFFRIFHCKKHISWLFIYDIFSILEGRIPVNDETDGLGSRSRRMEENQPTQRIDSKRTETTMAVSIQGGCI